MNTKCLLKVTRYLQLDRPAAKTDVSLQNCCFSFSVDEFLSDIGILLSLEGVGISIGSEKKTGHSLERKLFEQEVTGSLHFANFV